MTWEIEKFHEICWKISPKRTKNDLVLPRFIHFLKQRVFTKTSTEVTYACCLCEYRTVNGQYKNVDTKNLNVHVSNKFQDRLSNQNLHLLPIHRFPTTLIATVFLNGVKNLVITRYPNVCTRKKQRTQTQKRTKNVPDSCRD